ncbi:hypothetical protein EV702DRAFT_1231395 [Suillus placidus]|uniref:Zn(2)-C6 fungal-type domain-containing protein n=1 Tax=Suillus placidus TaxID=48579 RepID=A0A9P7D7G6_9AGAM|nr:hypothetical protein EV702DRAFT_1231395 [Suillus placidus]
MTNFDLTMLTASPSPSPSPEALPLSATALVSQEESAETRITRTWRTICDQVRTLVLMVPDARGELIEEQESWMWEWSSLLMSMTACGKDGAAAKVPFRMEGKDTAALASGRKSHRTLEKLVKSWKAKAILPAVEEPEVATVRPIVRVVEVVLLAAGSSSKAPAEEEECITPPDMGESVSGGRKSVPVAPRCERCVDAKLHCIFEKGKRCDACAHARKGCSFVSKRKAPAARVTKVTKARESTVESTKRVAASTAGGDVDESSSEAEVEIVGERIAKEKVIHGSLTMPPRAIKPLPACPAPARLRKSKAKAVDSEEVLALTLAENMDLKEEVARLKEVLAQVRFHAHTEQVEMITLSNKAYTNAQDWATVEMKLAELLD